MQTKTSVKDILNSVINKLNTFEHVTWQMKKPFIELSKKFNEVDDNKKVNLSFFGDLSAGKTTLINLMIRQLITQRTNKTYIHKEPHAKTPLTANINDPNRQEEGEEEEEEEEEEEQDGYVKLTTREIENTYFINFIESSESGAYDVILEVNSEEEKITLMKIEALKGKKFDCNNQIIFRFLNNDDGIKSLNKFLNDIDKQCFHLIRNRRMVDLDPKQQSQQEFKLSKMTIKIPDFPKEYRLIDCPGLSISTFRKAFIKMLNGLNSMNFFLIVNDIFAKVTYSLSDDILKEISTDYGSPMLYSFITKGNKFLHEFPKIDKNYKAYVRTNNIKFINLQELKTNIHFRKVIRINDKNLNQDMKKCLNAFFADLVKIKNECGIAHYEESIMHMLRKTIQDMNITIANDFILSPEQMETLKQKAGKAKSDFEKYLRDYLNNFNCGEKSFIEKYPDYYDELCAIYNRYDYLNDHNRNRNNYIEKHIKLSTSDFQNIILRKPQKYVVTAFNLIFEEVNENIRDKILRKLKIEGLMNENSDSVNIGERLLFLSLNNLDQISPISVLFSLVELISLNPGPCFPGDQIVKVLSYLPGKVDMPSFFLDTFFGTWYIQNTREEITKGLLQLFNKNKSTIIKESLERFENSKTKILNNLMDFKVFETMGKDLILECDKFKKSNKNFSNPDFEKEFLSIVEDHRLKNFFEKVFAYTEE